MPVILYQCWSFVAPGLYANEKRIAGPLLVSSILLFYGGVAFAYYVVFPLVFGFFTSVGPEMVNISTDIGRYLDFVLALFFGFGLAFEVPIATIILVAIGLTTPQKLGEKRPFVIVGAFILGMMLTPPDIISQVLLALPIWVLFEAGLIASKIIFKDREQEADEDEADDDSAAVAVHDPQPLTDEEMAAEKDQTVADEGQFDKQ
jgi:sec-independent protein translocase protein TatC